MTLGNQLKVIAKKFMTCNKSRNQVTLLDWLKSLT